MGEAPERPVAPAPRTPPNPLDRFTSGGWLAGVLRLGLGAAIVYAVVHFFARDALSLLLTREVTPILLAGAAVHLLQRAARIFKWVRMIAPSGLRDSRPWHLLRIQLIGMLANLLLPVSEAIKVWAVSRDRPDAVVAAESIVVDTALHTAMIGAAGIAGVSLAGTSSHPAVLWGAAVALTAIPPVVIVALRRRRRGRAMHVVDGRVLAWCAVETLCQLGVYGLAMHAIGVSLPPAALLSLAPILFLADLVMVTPSGLGLREALFAVVLDALSDAPADASVAVALLVTTMLLVASAAGGGLALLLPAREGAVSRP